MPSPFSYTLDGGAGAGSPDAPGLLTKPDVRLYQINDDGEIDMVAGQFVMSDGLETAVYLSLFGGNDEDSGLEADDLRQWWGNLEEPDLTRRYRSETQFLLESLPLVPANLRRVEDAAGRDLAWMVGGVASSVEVTASVPALNTIRVAIALVVDDAEYDFAFTRSARERVT